VTEKTPSNNNIEFRAAEKELRRNMREKKDKRYELDRLHEYLAVQVTLIGK